ncbi:MAG TPA: ABC transporter ATP-binding protein [Rickettsiales bacterium]|nr:ABC transporter ATP-binding protein [Rickettsiales bacterium]
MITVQNLSFEYPGKRALDHVSFHVPAGSITALVGPNGAGKTTLLRCIAALDEPLEGNILVDGIDTCLHPRQVHRVLGYLSDSFGLYDDLTVEQCLIFTARARQVAEARIAAQVEWAAAALELTQYLPKKAGTLSRGWRQRVGIAQAIIHSPKLLLLDEPASGLDPEARIALSALLRKLCSQGMTILVSSHILAELEDYCTSMLVLRNGHISEPVPPAAPSEESCIIEVTLLETSSAASFLPLLQSHPAVRHTHAEGNLIRLSCHGTEAHRVDILRLLVTRGAPVSSFTVKHARLQDIYLSLGTQKEQEDAPES